MGKTTKDDKKRMLSVPASIKNARGNARRSGRPARAPRLWTPQHTHAPPFCRLKVYHTRKEPFSSKELVTAGKLAGLNDKLVPDINAMLMDDGYVQTDKIGSGNYFWSFPGAQGAAARKAVEEAQAALGAAKGRLAAAKEADAASRAGREDADGTRATKLAELDGLVAKRRGLEERLEAMKANAPEELARITAAAEAMKQHAIRWTENLFAIKSYLVQKKGVHSSQVDELFKSVGLPKNIDIE